MSSRAKLAPATGGYRLLFDRDALEEWKTLDGSVKTPLRKLLAKRLQSPHVPGDALRGGLKNCYKIKLRKQGYRLIYQVFDERVVVLVIAVGKREREAVYEAALARLASLARK